MKIFSKLWTKSITTLDREVCPFMQGMVLLSNIRLCYKACQGKIC